MEQISETFNEIQNEDTISSKQLFGLLESYE